MGSRVPPRSVENLEVPSDPVEFALFGYVRRRHGDDASHPLDWNRFYRFVVLAHVRRKGWDAHDVKARMVRYGLPKVKATEMAEVYWHCRCALCVRSRRTNRVVYAQWMRSNGSRLT